MCLASRRRNGLAASSMLWPRQWCWPWVDLFQLTISCVERESPWFCGVACARAAFECGGSQWRAVSSRILSCKLKWSCRELPQEDGSTRMHIIVCYTPTFHSSRHDKDVFYGQLTRVSAAERAAFEFVFGRCCCRFRHDSDLRRRLRFCS